MPFAPFRKTPLALAVGALVGLSVMLTGCGGSSSSSKKSITAVEFIGMEAPSNASDMSHAYSAATARVTYDDDTTADFPLSYNVLFNSTDHVGTNAGVAGQLYDFQGNPLMDPLGQPVVAETPDGNSLLKVGKGLFLVTHWEYDWILSDGSEGYKVDGWYSRMPMSMTLTTLSQDNNGVLSALEQKPIDFSGVSGIWIPCFASQTPWNTHLGSEEDYDADAKTIEAGTNHALDGMNDLYFQNTQTANPYHYGIFPEVTVSEGGDASVTKHWAMGRGTWEMGKVMPDARTVYYGDDGTNVGLFMFVADQANDLSAGTLYAAHYNEISTANGGSGSLTWIRLGHGTDSENRALADSLKFSDIFDSTTADETANWADLGYKAIRAGYSSTEYIRLKSGMEHAAAFLESRRYAAWLGATTEWNKMEGITVDGVDKQLYIAMSYIDKGMLADDTAPVDHIKLPKKINAGGTFQLPLASGQVDSNGTAINSEYVATGMSVPSALLGEDISTDALGNTANPDKVANVDNIFFSDKMRTLFIGEDSGTHVNNFVWAYNVETKKLSRILSLAAGAEATGLQVVENLNGHAYIMSNAQHQGDFVSTTNETLKAEMEPMINKFVAPVGYIGGLPGL